MARSLSSQFLGPQHAIDVIPHTAILVYGREYFYGGGIQSTTPEGFRASTGMLPMQILELGVTLVSKYEFDKWCHQMMSTGFYSAHDYDLLHRNCNNFSHDAARFGLRLPKGVPDWILQVPQRFLSSPMGQMVRPMLEQMQITGSSPISYPQQASSSFSSSSPTASHTFSSVAATTKTTTTPNTSISKVSPVKDSVHPNKQAANDTNPWQSIPSHLNSPANNKNTETMHSITNPTSNSNNVMKLPTRRICDSFTKPFLSKDTKSISLCVSKIVPGCSDADSKSAVLQLGNALQEPQSRPLRDDCVLDTAMMALLDVLYDTTIAPPTTFILMLLRLVVLQYPNSVSVQPCVDWIVAQLQQTDETGSSGIGTSSLPLSTPARSMAWCVLSNSLAAAMTGHNSSNSSSRSQDDDDDDDSYIYYSHSTSSDWARSLIECAIRDISPELGQARVEVRQAASCFLYNWVLLFLETHKRVIEKDEEDELEEAVCSVLCAILENLPDETDGTTRLRRLLIVAHIVQANRAARELVRDLGFEDTLRQVISKGKPTSASASNHSGNTKKTYHSKITASYSSDTETCIEVAEELLPLLDM